MKPIRGRVARLSALVLGLGLLGFGNSALAAGSAGAGRDKAHKCEACHGLDGRSKIAEAPNLAGQIENYLISQLRAFKAGERKSELMSIVAPTLSAQDIEDLAAYYSAIEVTVGKVPAN